MRNTSVLWITARRGISSSRTTPNNRYSNPPPARRILRISVRIPNALPANVFEWNHRDYLNLTTDDTDGDGLEDSWELNYWEHTRNLGIDDALNYTSTYDVDEDGISDGQEYNGYNITIVWTEEDETKSKEKRIYGDPLLPYAGENGNLLDVDEDGIPDYIEADPYNVTDNSTIVDYVKSHNHTSIKNQFNPLVRENIPPMIEDMKVTLNPEWGKCGIEPLTIPCIVHYWSVISVRIFDISSYTVTIKVLDNGRYEEFSGWGSSTFIAKIDIDYWTDVLIDYTVRITAIDAASNEMQMDKTIEGALDFLEDIWNAIVGIMTAAWEAVAGAVNFVIDLILDVTAGIFDTAIRPILDAIEEWASGVIGRFMELMEREGKDNHSSNGLSDLTSRILGGTLFYVLVGIVTAISTIVLFATPFLSVFSILLGILGPLLVDLLMGLLGAAMSTDFLVSSVQVASGLISVFHVVRSLWNTPDIVLQTLNLIFWLLSFWASKTSLLIAVGEGLPFAKQAVGFILSIIGLSLSVWSFDSEGDPAFVAAVIGVFLSAVGLFFVWRGKTPIPLWNYICLGVASGSLAFSSFQALAVDP